MNETNNSSSSCSDSRKWDNRFGGNLKSQKYTKMINFDCSSASQKILPLVLLLFSLLLLCSNCGCSNRATSSNFPANQDASKSSTSSTTFFAINHRNQNFSQHHQNHPHHQQQQSRHHQDNSGDKSKFKITKYHLIPSLSSSSSSETTNRTKLSKNMQFISSSSSSSSSQKLATMLTNNKKTNFKRNRREQSRARLRSRSQSSSHHVQRYGATARSSVSPKPQLKPKSSIIAPNDDAKLNGKLHHHHHHRNHHHLELRNLKNIPNFSEYEEDGDDGDDGDDDEDVDRSVREREAYNDIHDDVDDDDDDDNENDENNQEKNGTNKETESDEFENEYDNDDGDDDNEDTDDHNDDEHHHLIMQSKKNSFLATNNNNNNNTNSKAKKNLLFSNSNNDNDNDDYDDDDDDDDEDEEYGDGEDENDDLIANKKIEYEDEGGRDDRVWNPRSGVLIEKSKSQSGKNKSRFSEQKSLSRHIEVEDDNDNDNDEDDDGDDDDDDDEKWPNSAIITSETTAESGGDKDFIFVKNSNRNLHRSPPELRDDELKGKSISLINLDNLCDTIRCDRDEYCTIPRPGVAQCAKSRRSFSNKSSRQFITSLATEKDLDDDDEDDDDDDDDDEDDENRLLLAKKSKTFDLDWNFNDDHANNNNNNNNNHKYRRQQKQRRHRLPLHLPAQIGERFNSSKIVQCPSCPFGSGQMICATDNRTYSSTCRMEFHNCIHRSDIRFACFGYCPCMLVYEKVMIPLLASQATATTARSNISRTKKLDQKWMNNNDNNQNNQNNKNQSMSQIIKRFIAQQQHAKTSVGARNRLASPNSILQPQNKMINLDYHRHSSLSHMPTSWPPSKPECTAEQLQSMGLRLLEWFTVVMTEELTPNFTATWKKQKIQSKSKSKSRKSTIPNFDVDCEPQAAFMFSHFDANRDRKLSVRELYYLEHDENEHCLEHYLLRCDTDRDQYLSTGEWCSCFSLKAKPCAYNVKYRQTQFEPKQQPQKQQGRRESGDEASNVYVPQCNSAGQYEKVQCHRGHRGHPMMSCWCSDRNGNEIAGTRVRGRRPNCDKTYPLTSSSSVTSKTTNITIATQQQQQQQQHQTNNNWKNSKIKSTKNVLITSTTTPATAITLRRVNNRKSGNLRPATSTTTPKPKILAARQKSRDSDFSDDLEDDDDDDDWDTAATSHSSSSSSSRNNHNLYRFDPGSGSVDSNFI